MTKSGGYIFGGFSGETPWSSTGGYQQSAGAWMYFLNTRQTLANKWQWNTQLQPDKALFFSASHSFTMGEGHDLFLDMDKPERSYCRVTNTYLPSAGGSEYKGEELVDASFAPAEFIVYSTTAMPKLNWLNFASSLIQTSPITSWLSAIGRVIGPVLYDNERDGWGANNFHKAVDGSTHTLLVVKTQNGYVFGGYTGNLRHSGAINGYTKMPSSTAETERPWLYTLKTRIAAADYKQMRILPANDYTNALMNRNDYMWTQGDGHDLHIDKIRDRSYVKWGVQYDFPVGDKMLTGEAVVGRSDGTSEMFYPETVLVYSTLAKDVVESTETGLDD